IVLGVFAELGVLSSIRLVQSSWQWHRGSFRRGRLERAELWIGLCAGVAILASGAAAVAPVTDGVALWYHRLVAEGFLRRGSSGFLADLHEAVYPLVTEMLYAIALEIRGPVACRGIQWFLGLALAFNVIALARPVLGRRAWWAGALVLLTPAVSNGM